VSCCDSVGNIKVNQILGNNIFVAVSKMSGFTNKNGQLSFPSNPDLLYGIGSQFE